MISIENVQAGATVTLTVSNGATLTGVLREEVTRYGPQLGIWFAGSWFSLDRWGDKGVTVGDAESETVAQLVRERETEARERRKAERYASLYAAQVRISEHRAEAAELKQSTLETEVLRAHKRTDAAWSEIHRLRRELNRRNGRRLSPHKLIRTWIGGQP